MDTYITAPLLKVIVTFFNGFFILLDKVTGQNDPLISDEESIEEYRRRTNLSLSNVPIEFHTLVPLAAKWGISDDAIREDVTEAATEVEKHQLISALSGNLDAINRWIDSFPEDSMSDEAAAFMYMLEAVEELDLDVEYE